MGLQTQQDQEPDAKASTDLSPLLARCSLRLPYIRLRKGFTDRIPDDELESIRSRNLDVLLPFRFSHHPRRNLGCSPLRRVVDSTTMTTSSIAAAHRCFWEIYEQNPVSGTILRILTDSLDGGHVIYRGHSSTDKSSLYRSRNPIYWKTAEYALRRLRDLNDRGMEYIESLRNLSRERDRIRRGIYRTPHAWQMAKFLTRLFYRSLAARLSSRLHGSTPAMVSRHSPTNPGAQL